MGDFLGKVLIWVSTISFTSLMVAIIYNWIAGHFDTKKMLQSAAIMFTMAGGIIITGIIVNNVSIDSAKNSQSFCTNSYPYLCGSWPVFSEVVGVSVGAVINSLNITGSIASGIISSLSCLYIYSRLIKGVWLGNKEIAAAFMGGVVLYLTISNFTYFKDSVWNMVDQIFMSDGRSNLDAFLVKYTNWNTIASQASFKASDDSIFKGFMSKMTGGFSGWLLQAFQAGLLQVPLMFLGLLNALIIILQQLFICIIPISILKSLLTFENNPFIAIKSIFGYSMFCVGLHIELMVLSFVPSAPESANLWTLMTGSASLLLVFTIIIALNIIMTAFVCVVLFSILKPLLSLATL